MRCHCRAMQMITLLCSIQLTQSADVYTRCKEKAAQLIIRIKKLRRRFSQDISSKEIKKAVPSDDKEDPEFRFVHLCSVWNFNFSLELNKTYLIYD